MDLLLLGGVQNVIFNFKGNCEHENDTNEIFNFL